MPVNTQHEDYARMLPKWERCRDVAEGEDAVHAAGEKYLPKLKEQTPEEYSAYVLRTPFYNASWRTLAGLVGMVLRKPPTVKVPDAAEELLKDVTLSGVPLQLFLTQGCTEGLLQGRVGILVDYPDTPVEGLTLADAQRLNLRPTMCLYRTESIINWRYERVNNVWQLVLVVLKEREYAREDEFKQKCKDRFRVLDLIEGRYRVRNFEVVEGKDVLLNEVVPMMNGKPLDYIPFTFVTPDTTSGDVEDPPLIDLVNMNLSHYRTSADLEHGAHFTGLPTPWVAGYKPDNQNDKLYIGSSAAWTFSDPNAQVGFLEFTGQGLSALKELKEAKEKQMAVLGARLLEQQKRAPETADSQSQQRKGEESLLAAASQSMSLCFTRALRWFVAWAGVEAKPDEVELELNREFYSTPMSAQMLAALVSAYQQGAISFETLWSNLQAGDVADEDVDAEEEQTRIGDVPPNLQGLNIDPITGMPLPPNKLPKQGASDGEEDEDAQPGKGKPKPKPPVK